MHAVMSVILISKEMNTSTPHNTLVSSKLDTTSSTFIHSCHTVLFILPECKSAAYSMTLNCQPFFTIFLSHTCAL